MQIRSHSDALLYTRASATFGSVRVECDARRPCPANPTGLRPGIPESAGSLLLECALARMCALRSGVLVLYYIISKPESGGRIYDFHTIYRRHYCE